MERLKVFPQQVSWVYILVNLQGKSTHKVMWPCHRSCIGYLAHKRECTMGTSHNDGMVMTLITSMYVADLTMCYCIVYFAIMKQVDCLCNWSVYSSESSAHSNHDNSWAKTTAWQGWWWSTRYNEKEFQSPEVHSPVAWHWKMLWWAIQDYLFNMNIPWITVPITVTAVIPPIMFNYYVMPTY